MHILVFTGLGALSPGPTELATKLQSLRNHLLEVAEVEARFYKGHGKVADQSLIKISHQQPFEHAQKTSSD